MIARVRSRVNPSSEEGLQLDDHGLPVGSLLFAEAPFGSWVNLKLPEDITNHYCLFHKMQNDFVKKKYIYILKKERKKY